MRIEQFLKRNEKVSLSAEGTTINLKQGEFVRVVTTPHNFVYDLERGDQVQLPDGKEFTSLQVTNLAADSDIVLAHLFGNFTPTLDGSKLNIQADFEATNLEVSFKGRQPVSLLPTTEVKSVVQNFPEIQRVQVENQLNVPEIQKVHIVEESAPTLRWVAHDTMTVTGRITGNVKRKELLLQADASNSGTIWLGGFEGKGFPILAGAGFVLSNGAEIDILIPANCKLYVSEVTA